MPHIYPLEGQKHFHLTKELTDLGGTRGYNFRLGIAWDGEHYFEVAEDEDGLKLYRQWLSLHGDTSQDGQDVDEQDPEPLQSPQDAGSRESAPDDPAAEPGPGPETDAPSDTVPDDPAAEPGPGPEADAPVEVPESPQDASTSGNEARDSSDDTVTEPPAESEVDSAAETAESTQGTDGEADEADSDETAKAEPASSGTTRKRSAKNSTRRP